MSIGIVLPMNKLPFEKRRQIIHAMVEGNSVRGIARLVDVSPVTVLRYLALAGEACAKFHDSAVRNLKIRRAECDETWSFIFAKDKNANPAMKAAGAAGSIWTWTCLDPDSRLLVSYAVGDRNAEMALAFMRDVASRVVGRFQLTTDSFAAYYNAVSEAFEEIDYAMLVKIYGESLESGPERKYSPAECVGTKKKVVSGNPDMKYVSTSLVEKHNQTMRQHMKRFARLTAAHSKKLQNHIHMVALYTTWYNYARINSAVKMSPAMAAGISDTLWDIADIVKLIENLEEGEL
jgi:IS1 family transposase